MRYFLAFLVALVLIFSLFLLLFHHGSSKPKIATGHTLLSYSTTDAIAQLTIDGPINADQTHEAIQISVGRDQVVYENITGYQGTVVQQQTFANNTNAYANFLVALSRAGFTKGNISPTLKDERGYCAEGDRYIFELTQDNQTIERFWATNCGPKTYLGSLDLTLTLFKAQVPDYNKVTQNILL
jgi:hypothetical protein